MKYAILTFGCRVNQADSMQLEDELRGSGAEASTLERADAVFVNTCSVTATADQAARQAIRRIHRTNPSARIIATGCYATRRPDQVQVLSPSVRVVPNEAKGRLLALVSSDPGLPTTAERFGGGDGACGAPLAPGLAGRTAFTLRVQTGCDQICAYCIIPTTRGRGASRSLATVREDVARLTGAGFKEIVIAGVHLGSYGRDLDPPSRLVDLLRALDAASGDVHFRVSSLEPMDCGPEVVDLLAESGRFAPHFHLPLQHASDRLLALMQRPYTSAFYRRLVEDIRARLPHAAIGSDVIVGFPGETDADFDLLDRFLEDTPLTHLHVFPYSDRPGTAATGMSGKVHGTTVRERALRVRASGQRLARQFRSSQIGSVRPALTIEDGALAVTDNYLKIRIPPGRERNERVRVRISEDAGVLVGAVAEKSG